VKGLYSVRHAINVLFCEAYANMGRERVSEKTRVYIFSMCCR